MIAADVLCPVLGRQSCCLAKEYIRQGLCAYIIVSVSATHLPHLLVLASCETLFIDSHIHSEAMQLS